MIQLGKFQDLYIVKKKEFGVYVNDQKDVTDGSILLPAKQVPDVRNSFGMPSVATLITGWMMYAAETGLHHLDYHL